MRSQPLFAGFLACALMVIPAFGADSPKYNDLFRVASHNSYSRDVAPSLTDVLPYTTSIELDIHPNGDTGTFDVYHVIKNPNNCAVDNGNYNYSMTVCLKAVKDWADRNPGQVITIFLDLKSGGFTTGADGTQLDSQITSVIPSGSIYKPSSLKSSYSNLRDAAQHGAWPTMEAMTTGTNETKKNTYIFALTGQNSQQSDYTKNANAVCFAAPDTSTLNDINDVPSGFTNETSGSVVFYNIHDTNLKNGDLTQTVFSRGYLSRVWSGSTNRENSMQVSLMSALKVQFAAFYNYKLKAPAEDQLQVIAYEDAYGWNGAGNQWLVSLGCYSYKGRGGYSDLPFPNDEIQAVYVPLGYSCYMTDNDDFKAGSHGTELVTGPAVLNINNGMGLAGKVSSMRVTRGNSTTCPSTKSQAGNPK